MVLASTRSLQDAADLLGIDQATLWRRRKQYGIWLPCNFQSP
jgi:NtrC-family two-component system response regulator AlgB